MFSDVTEVKYNVPSDEYLFIRMVNFSTVPLKKEILKWYFHKNHFKANSYR